MFKKGFLSVITVLMLLTPINVFAVQNTVTDEESTDSIKIEYKKDEQKELNNIPKVGCKAVYIAEPKTGKIIFEKNSHEKMYPASTTKILTALLTLEKCEPTDIAKVSKTALSSLPQGASNAKLQVDEELSISDLLYALLIPSANEAAIVLAEHISGSVESFADLCNNRAKELGCENLHFVNPNGLHDDNHYCTAYDLYLIAKECRKYDLFNEIVKTKSFTLPATNKYAKKDRTFTNTNELLLSNSKNYYYPYCDGIKTGHTTPAGNCLVASTSNENIDLISVVLGGGINSKGLNERFYDSIELFKCVYDNYSYKQIADKKQVLKTINVEKATKDTSSLDITVESDISTIVPNDIDKDNIEKVINLNERIVAPIKQNQVLGQVTFKADGVNITENLIASHDVEKIPYWIYNCIIVAIIIIVILIIIKVLKTKNNKGKRMK